MKKIALICLSMLVTTALSAQDITPIGKSFWSDPFNDPLFPLYMLSLFIFIVIILVLIVATIMLRVLNVMVRKATEENAAKLGIPYVPQQSWWEKFWIRINALVPVEKEKAIELAHDYDGIRELDNHLPPWWKWLFYFTIGWAVVYMVVYHVLDTLPLSVQEYENELALADEQARIFKASQPVAVIDENSLAFIKDEEIIVKGKKIFMSNNCGSCHRNDGGGNMIGPNLTDAYWLHGGDIKQIFSIIKNGAVEKAMPAWGKVMSQKDVRDVAFYVMSLQESNPENAKVSQGELYKPKPDTTSTDSLKVRALNE